MFRIFFLTIAALALAGTSYVAWYGYGSSSTDVAKSIRQGSNGAGVIAGRVK